MKSEEPVRCPKEASRGVLVAFVCGDAVHGERVRVSKANAARHPSDTHTHTRDSAACARRGGRVLEMEISFACVECAAPAAGFPKRKARGVTHPCAASSRAKHICVTHPNRLDLKGGASESRRIRHKSNRSQRHQTYAQCRTPAASSVSGGCVYRCRDEAPSSRSATQIVAIL